MIRIVLARIGLAIPVLFIVTFLTFLLVSLIPGNAATTILGENATPDKIAALNAELGLNKPLYIQYLNWLANAFGGNLGTSLYTGDAVSRILTDRMMPTIYIAGFATLVAAVIGIAIGTIAAVRGGAVARGLDILGMFGISLPNFWIALLLVVFISGYLGLLPSLGYVRPGQDVAGWAIHLILPVASLAVAGVAIIAKQTRDSMVEAVSRDFMRFMQANGIARNSLIFRHGLRYATPAIVAGVSSSFINLFGGTVALEIVFGIPGLGALVATSTLQHDLPAVQGAVLAYTIVLLLITLFADLAYAGLDPKAKTR